MECLRDWLRGETKGLFGLEMAGERRRVLKSRVEQTVEIEAPERGRSGGREQ
jgi:hypothetical protein